ncbi:MAG TPA: hypothetical protein VHW23_11170 [Kofleriaceae bacterium]|jgi:hypothetical protein|nr:hypothetical protein [Kofleriaceae bacterium]
MATPDRPRTTTNRDLQIHIDDSPVAMPVAARAFAPLVDPRCGTIPVQGHNYVAFTRGLPQSAAPTIHASSTQLMARIAGSSKMTQVAKP